MRMNKNYEAELNLKDLLFHILYKWRIVLLIGFIVAGIFGFREYWGFEKYHRNGELSPVEIQYEADVKANNQAIERAKLDAAGYEDIIQSLARYRDTSVIMNLDPTDVWTAEKTYYLNIDNQSVDAGSAGNWGNKILTVLSEAISEDADKEMLMEIFGTDDWKDINEVTSISVSRVMNTISVVGCGSTEEEAIRRKEFADGYFQAANEKLQKTVDYSLEVISENTGRKAFLTTKGPDGVKVEKDLAAAQNAVSDSIRTNQNQQKGYLNTLKDLQSKSFVKPVPETKSQAIFGFALGAALVILFYTVVYLFNGKLKTIREMQKRYEVAILGIFSHSRAWWKGKGLDGILERLEFGKKTNMENELDSIASLISEEKDGLRILLTGTLEKKEMNQVYEGLIPRLKEKGIELVIQAEYLHNSDAVEASREMDSVILVEERYKSKIRDLNRMAEMITIKDANVIGTILI